MKTKKWIKVCLDFKLSIKEFEAPKKEKKKTKTEKPAVSPTATASEKTVKPDKDKKPAKKIDQKKSKKA